MSLEDPSNYQIGQLLRVLKRDVKEQANMIERLPGDLRRQRLLPSFMHRKHPAAPACSVHKALNNRLIHSLFNAIAIEVGINLNTFTANMHRLTKDQKDIIFTLRELHGLWLTEADYYKTFLSTPDPAWPYQSDKCEACMLSHIGKNPDMLVNLHIVLKSRTRRSRRYSHLGPPKLLRWIEEWINTYARKLAKEMFVVSHQEGSDLKVIRGRIGRERGDQRRVPTQPKFARPATAPEDSFSIQADETEVEEYNAVDPNAAELSVMDHYAALTSTTYLPQFDTHEAGSAQRAYADVDRPTHSIPPMPSKSSLRPISLRPYTPVANHRRSAYRAIVDAGVALGPAENQASEYMSILDPPSVPESNTDETDINDNASDSGSSYTTITSLSPAFFRSDTHHSTSYAVSPPPLTPRRASTTATPASRPHTVVRYEHAEARAREILRERVDAWPLPDQTVEPPDIHATTYELSQEMTLNRSRTVRSMVGRGLRDAIGSDATRWSRFMS